MLPRERPVSSTSTGFLHRGMCRGVGRNDEGLKLHSGGLQEKIPIVGWGRPWKCLRTSAFASFNLLHLET